MVIDGSTRERHEHYMRRCLWLAREALAAGEVTVGAIVVQGDRVVGEGRESTAHLRPLACRHCTTRRRRQELARGTRPG